MLDTIPKLEEFIRTLSPREQAEIKRERGFFRVGRALTPAILADMVVKAQANHRRISSEIRRSVDATRTALGCSDVVEGTRERIELDSIISKGDRRGGSERREAQRRVGQKRPAGVNCNRRGYGPYTRRQNDSDRRQHSTFHVAAEVEARVAEIEAARELPTAVHGMEPGVVAAALADALITHPDYAENVARGARGDVPEHSVVAEMRRESPLHAIIRKNASEPACSKPLEHSTVVSKDVPHWQRLGFFIVRVRGSVTEMCPTMDHVDDDDDDAPLVFTQQDSTALRANAEAAQGCAAGPTDPPAVEHRCGVRGFDPLKGDICLACTTRLAANIVPDACSKPDEHLTGAASTRTYWERLGYNLVVERGGLIEMCPTAEHDALPREVTDGEWTSRGWVPNPPHPDGDCSELFKHLKCLVEGNVVDFWKRQGYNVIERDGGYVTMCPTTEHERRTLGERRTHNETSHLSWSERRRGVQRRGAAEGCAGEAAVRPVDEYTTCPGDHHPDAICDPCIGDHYRRQRGVREGPRAKFEAGLQAMAARFPGVELPSAQDLIDEMETNAKAQGFSVVEVAPKEEPFGTMRVLARETVHVARGTGEADMLLAPICDDCGYPLGTKPMCGNCAQNRPERRVGERRADDVGFNGRRQSGPSDRRDEYGMRRQPVSDRRSGK